MQCNTCFWYLLNRKPVTKEISGDTWEERYGYPPTPSVTVCTHDPTWVVVRPKHFCSLYRPTHLEKD